MKKMAKLLGLVLSIILTVGIITYSSSWEDNPGPIGTNISSTMNA